MKHFICEFITAGGMRDQPLPLSLKLEGWLMLQTLARELVQNDECEIITTRDNRIEPFEFTSYPIDDKTDVWQLWGNCIDKSDCFWPIAPETNGSLLQLTRLAEKKDCTLMGSDAIAIQQCSSKHKLAQSLAKYNIPAIQTFRLGNHIPDSKNGWIIKPDIGAGCEECYHIQDKQRLQQFIQQCTELDRFIIQPFMIGTALSLTTLMYQGESIVLACNKQNIEFDEGQLNLSGLVVNACADQRDKFQSVSNEIAGLFPGLAGIVGIDIILTGNVFFIVEINPRLTTAFTGLSRSLGINATRLLRDLFINERLPTMTPDAQPVTLTF